jgi:hypothetical protein
MKIKISTIVDYLILTQIVAAILIYKFVDIGYKGIIVIWSCIIFICYWMIKLIFNPKMEKYISG